MEDLSTEEVYWIIERDADVEEAGQEFAGGLLEAYAKNIAEINCVKKNIGLN